jgi:cell division protein FtsI/penicillin-binding protein 2
LVPSLALCLGFGAIGAQHARLATWERAEHLELAREHGRLMHKITIEARRGDVLDRRERALARSESGWWMTLTPALLTESPAFWMEVSEVTGLPADQGIALARRKAPGVEWQEALDADQRRRLIQIARKYRVDGIGFRPAGVRTYPAGSALAPLLGFLDGSRPACGVELGYDRYLRGKDGVEVGYVDRSGRTLPWLEDPTQSSPAEDGADVVLTIDRDLQTFASERLSEACEFHGAWQGVVIVMETGTGNVRAMATWPTFDPSDPIPARQRALRGETASPEINPAVSVILEPGSTFKVFTIALGMETGALTEQSVVSCRGSIPVANHRIHCALHGTAGHGQVTPERCVEVSCNVAAATWGMRIGYKSWYAFLERLGILEKPAVSLPGELQGRFNWQEYNKPLQVATLSFGQSINVTPLMLASAFTVFGNDGVMVRPRLVERIGNQEQPFPPATRIFRHETARSVLAMMKRVVQGEHGTGRALKIEGVEIAGKSGTAQKRDPKTGKMSRSLYVSSFVGYVPGNSPDYTVLVMIDSPTKNGYYGAAVAGPVFRAVAEYLLRSGGARTEGGEEIGAVQGTGSRSGA